MNRILKIVVVVFLLLPNTFLGQERSEAHSEFRHFLASVILAHSFIPSGSSKGKLITTIPSFGFDIDYWFTEKIAIGFHYDLKLEYFEINGKDDISYERQYPFVITLDIIYKFYEEFNFIFGYGQELEETQNFHLIRFGLEHEFKIGNHWDFSPGINYDIRFGNYGTWNIGIGVGKKF